MATDAELLTSVEELPTISASLDELFTILQGLIGSHDQAKIDQALSIITTFKDNTKAAILANTPAAPVP